MKRVLIGLIILIVFCFSSFAWAEDIRLEQMSADTLYALRAQMEAQLLTIRLEEREAYATGIHFDSYERTPSQFVDNKITFSGTVEQVLEGKNGLVNYRISFNGNDNQIFYVHYKRVSGQSRLLVGDRVVVYGTFTGLQTYTSTTNRWVAVPSCKAELIVRSVTREDVQAMRESELENAIHEVSCQLERLNPADSEGVNTLSHVNYEDFARQVDRHKGKWVVFEGDILQVVEGSTLTLRIAMEGAEDQVVYTKYTPKESDVRFLEGDEVFVYARAAGLQTYSSTQGGEITIPLFLASNIEMGFSAASLDIDEAGYTIVDLNGYQNYARMPEAHEDEKIRFSGKVIQVTEGNLSSQYRIAVDGDENAIMYVTLSSDKDNLRVLLDDEVTVYGTFKDLFTYTSTMNVRVTVPSCAADLITVDSFVTEQVQKNENGSYTVIAANYDSFAREDELYMNETVTFEAKVEQVIEGSGFSSYRLAVDGSTDCMFFAQVSDQNRNVLLLEGDRVTVTARYAGLYTYKSSYGGMITLPSCSITDYTLKTQANMTSAAADPEGYIWISKFNFDEYARNANAHIGEKIRFMGEVVQVIESPTRENTYRLAVDDNDSHVFYVEYKLPRERARILDGDKVMFSGTFYGLHSYVTTIDSQRTIPCAIADYIGEPPYASLSRGAGGENVAALKLRLQELGYLAADAPTTGSYNNACQEAVKRFQTVHGLQETGTADVHTLIMLYSDQAQMNDEAL